MNRICKCILIIAAFMTMSAMFVTEGSAEELQELAEQLQKTPTDDALRARIIRLAAEAATPPPIPPEARRHFVMGGTYLKESKAPADFNLAIGAYQEALKLAPWWGDAYFNASVAFESAGSLSEAKKALETYLLTKPKDAEEAQNRIFSLEAKMVLEKRKSVTDDAAAIIRTQEQRLYGPWEHAYSLGAGDTRLEILYIQKDDSGKWAVLMEHYMNGKNTSGKESRWSPKELGGDREFKVLNGVLSFIWVINTDNQYGLNSASYEVTGTVSPDGNTFNLAYTLMPFPADRQDDKLFPRSRYKSSVTTYSRRK